MMEKTDYGETLELPNMADVDLPRERKRFTQSPPEGHQVIIVGASRLTSRAGNDYLALQLVGISGDCEGATEVFSLSVFHPDPQTSGGALGRLKLIYKTVGVDHERKIGDIFFRPFSIEVRPPDGKYTSFGRITPVPTGANLPSERQLREKHKPFKPSPSRSKEGGDDTSIGEIRQEREENKNLPSDIPF